MRPVDPREDQEGSLSKERHDRRQASVRSRYADDPLMGEIVQRFSVDLSERSHQFGAAMEEVDLDRLAALAHQLKGTAGGYGYDSIGMAAAALEQETIAIEADLSLVRERVEDLILLCRAASTQ